MCLTAIRVVYKGLQVTDQPGTSPQNLTGASGSHTLRNQEVKWYHSKVQTVQLADNSQARSHTGSYPAPSPKAHCLSQQVTYPLNTVDISCKMAALMSDADKTFFITSPPPPIISPITTSYQISSILLVSVLPACLSLQKGACTEYLCCVALF